MDIKTKNQATTAIGCRIPASLRPLIWAIPAKIETAPRAAENTPISGGGMSASHFPEDSGPHKSRGRSHRREWPPTATPMAKSATTHALIPPVTSWLNPAPTVDQGAFS